MRKNKFLSTTFILMIGGLFTKVLGFIIRIIYTRMVGEDGINLYSIVMPTYSLLMAIATLSLPIVISKMVSEKKKRSIKILSNATFIILLLNILIIIIVYFSKDFLANNLLHEPRASELIMAMALTFPFVSLSCVLKGYFYGKQRMMPHTISNILEQIVRIICIYLFIPHLAKYNVVNAVKGLILISIASELTSIITFLMFAPKKFIIKKDDLKPDLATTKEIMKISMPTVSSRLIGNIGFFLEPIILNNILLYSGYQMSYILNEYGAYNAYAISLLSMPSFFIGAISSSLLPEISKYYGEKNYYMIKRRIKQALLLSLIVGLIFSSVIFIFRDFLLNILYNTNNGSNYIALLAPFFVLFYLEAPMQSILQALGEASSCMKITLFAIIIKLLVMAFLSLCHIGIYSLVISEIVDIIIVVLLSIKKIKKCLLLK